MSDSIDRKPEENTKEALGARLAKYESKPMQERTEPSDLPAWVKVALVKREVFGLSWEEAASEFGRKAGTLKSYGLSPIAKTIRKQVAEWRDDPIEVAKAFMAGNALNLTIDRFVFLDWAKQARDYQAADKIAADLQDRIGITKKAPKDNKSVIVLNLGNTSLEIPMGDSRVQQIEEGDFEVIDDA